MAAWSSGIQLLHRSVRPRGRSLPGRRFASGFFCVVLPLLCASSAASARAQDRALSWSAPAGCPQTQAVRDQLQALSEEQPPQLEVHGQVTRAGRRRYRLQLSIKLGEQRAARTLVSSNCDELTRAATWLVAVFVRKDASYGNESAEPAEVPSAARTAPPPSADSPDPSQEGEPAEPQRLPAPALDAAPTTEDEEPDQTEQKHWEIPPLSVELAARTGMWSAGLPAPQLSLGGSLLILSGTFYASVFFDWVFARSKAVVQDVSLSASHSQVGAAVCGRWGKDWWAGPCLGASFLQTRAEGKGIQEAQSQRILWGTTTLSASSGWPRDGRFGLVGEGGLAVPVSPRPRFTVDGLGTVAQASWLSVFLRVGVSVRLH